MMRILYEAGCRKIQFGMESADNEILKKLKKMSQSNRLRMLLRMHTNMICIFRYLAECLGGDHGKKYCQI